MKISRAFVQRLRISVSERLTCLPGREPRTSSSFSTIASTSGSFTYAVADDDEAAAMSVAKRAGVAEGEPWLVGGASTRALRHRLAPPHSQPDHGRWRRWAASRWSGHPVALARALARGGDSLKLTHLNGATVRARSHSQLEVKRIVPNRIDCTCSNAQGEANVSPSTCARERVADAAS